MKKTLSKIIVKTLWSNAIFTCITLAKLKITENQIKSHVSIIIAYHTNKIVVSQIIALFFKHLNFLIKMC